MFLTKGDLEELVMMCTFVFCFASTLLLAILFSIKVGMLIGVIK